VGLRTSARSILPAGVSRVSLLMPLSALTRLEQPR
jgi:hypothetical protein